MYALAKKRQSENVRIRVRGAAPKMVMYPPFFQDLLVRSSTGKNKRRIETVRRSVKRARFFDLSRRQSSESPAPTYADFMPFLPPRSRREKPFGLWLTEVYLSPPPRAFFSGGSSLAGECVKRTDGCGIQHVRGNGGVRTWRRVRMRVKV